MNQTDDAIAREAAMGRANQAIPEGESSPTRTSPSQYGDGPATPLTPVLTLLASPTMLAMERRDGRSVPETMVIERHYLPTGQWEVCINASVLRWWEPRS